MPGSTTVVDQYSHAVINPRLQQLIADEESGALSDQDLLDEISSFIEETKSVTGEGTAFVAQMNLLKHLYTFYYDVHRRMVDIPIALLRG